MTTLLEQLRQARVQTRLLGLRLRRTGRGRRPHVPANVEREYFTFLRRALRVMRAEVVRRVLPMLREAVAAAARGDALEARADATGPILSELDGLQVSVERGLLQPTALAEQIRRWGLQVSTYQGSELQASIKAVLGIEAPIVGTGRVATLLRDWIPENVALIRTMHRRTFGEIEGIVTNGVAAGTRHEDLAAQIIDRFGVAESRAALIARDQVGKFYGQVQRARQGELGITRYVWRTSQDERVRPEHVEREGEIFEWSDPPEDGHPGFPINCRCTAEPVLGDVLDKLEREETQEAAET